MSMHLSNRIIFKRERHIRDYTRESTYIMDTFSYFFYNVFFFLYKMAAHIDYVLLINEVQKIPSLWDTSDKNDKNKKPRE